MLLGANFQCCTGPNIEKVIYSSGHSGTCGQSYENSMVVNYDRKLLLKSCLDL